jgi:3-methyladenine DNA glycosylase AlkC
MTQIEARTPARRIAQIPAAVRYALDRGSIESKNLVECLSIDLPTLLRHALPGLTRAELRQLHASAGRGWLERTRLVCAIIFERLGAAALEPLLEHRSDSVRGWGAGVIALIPNLSLADRLGLVRPLANDPNPNTRETAWLLIRPHIAVDIRRSVTVLTPWVHAVEPNIRRYAVEITRPRGVWCHHIEALKTRPALARPLLEAVYADPARYVQNSVANWLNDASKSAPEFVLRLTTTWRRRSDHPSTVYICRRACRTVRPDKRARRTSGG